MLSIVNYRYLSTLFLPIVLIHWTSCILTHPLVVQLEHIDITLHYSLALVQLIITTPLSKQNFNDEFDY